MSEVERQQIIIVCRRRLLAKGWTQEDIDRRGEFAARTMGPSIEG